MAMGGGGASGQNMEPDFFKPRRQNNLLWGAAIAGIVTIGGCLMTINRHDIVKPEKAKTEQLKAPVLQPGLK